MSEADVAVVRGCLEAWQRRDFETSMSYWAADGVWQSAGVDGTVYHGHAGVNRAMEEWTGAFSDYWLAADDLIDAGDGRVIMLWREGGRGRASGVPVEETGSTVFTIRNGEIVHARFYDTKEEALEVCGLSPR